MKPDPTIAAVREARHLISAAVDHDPKRLVEYYERRQNRRRERLLSAAPRVSDGEQQATPNEQ